MHCLDYVRRKRPLLVIAENSSRLASKKFADVRDMMVNHLCDSGYRVHFEVLNTKEQGLPQSRPRFYLVAFYRGNTLKPFTFPPKIEPIGLAKLLEPQGALPAVAHATPKAKERIRSHVRTARHTLESRGVRPEVCHPVIDIAASKGWAHVMTDCSPCLTASRCMRAGGHYLMSLGRTMTEKEMCRLQGIPDGRIDYCSAGVPKAEFLHAVGNAMSSNVVARILARALPAAGLASDIQLPTADDMHTILER